MSQRFNRQLKSNIKELYRRAEDLTTPLQVIGELMRASIMQNFEAEGRPEPWKQSIRARETGGQTLRKTGNLMGSIDYVTEDNALKIGTNVKYAATHQFGNPDRNIPQRKFLLFQDEDIEQIHKIIKTYLEGNL